MAPHPASPAGQARSTGTRTGPKHVVVVGGGVIGVCSAYFLARRGCRVTLLEADEIAGPRAASFGNAGLISIGHLPLPKPGLILRSFKWMFDRTSPLLIVPRPEPSLLWWLWGFARACSERQLEISMKAIEELSRGTMELFDHFAREERVNFEFRSGGYMDVFRTEEGYRHCQMEAEFLHRYGMRDEPIPGDEARRREPALLPGVAGALWHPDSGFAVPGDFVKGVAEAARRYGAEIREHAAMEEIEFRGGRAGGVRLKDGSVVEGDVVVLAAGSWTTGLAKKAGLRVPMQPAKGYHVTLAPPSDPALLPRIACSLGEAFVACTPMNGRIRLAGTLELSGLNLDIRPERLTMLPERAKHYVAGIEGATIESSWCGLRPCTADGLPAIGWSPRKAGVFVATGHAMMGFWTGPITGRVVSEAVLGEKTCVDLGPMGLDRL